AMIDRNNRLALTKQSALLGISRGSVYYEPAPVPDADLALMRRLDELHLEFPFAGSRMLRGLLAAEGSKIGTYIPMARGFVYLAAVMDWFARRILAWRLSNTMEASFCIDAVDEAIAKHGCPQIFNTDQGSQFTSASYRRPLETTYRRPITYLHLPDG